MTAASARRESRLTLARYAEYCGLDPQWLADTFRVEDDPRGGIGLPYGYGLPTKRRHHLEKPVGGNGYSARDDRFTWPKKMPIKHLLYGVEQCSLANDAFLVEGESDTQVLTFLGFAALGLPGAKCFGEDDQVRRLAMHQRIFVVHEPDDAGDWLIDKVRTSPLAPKAYDLVLDPHKDPRDMWLRLRPDRAGYVETMRALMEKAPRLDADNVVYAFARSGDDGKAVRGRGPFDRVVRTVLSDPALAGVRFDTMAGKSVLADGADIDERLISELRLRAETRKAAVSRNLALDAIGYVARLAAFDPLTEMLDKLPAWDDTPRLDTWLVAYAGADDDATARVCGRKWLISAMARAYRPGCQCKYVLVMQGPQDAGKSKLLARLAGDRFFMSMSGKPVTSRDTKVELHGKWVCEFPDLGTLPYTEANLIKAFISDTIDTATLKYDRDASDLRRRCVFAITENPDGAGWSSDTTGAVRFWPVGTPKIDIEAFDRDRDQLLAEALKAFRDGERWWFDADDPAPPELVERQEELRRIDDWEETLRLRLENDAETTTGYCLELLGVELPRRDKAATSRVGRILHTLGFKRGRAPYVSEAEQAKGVKRGWIYRRPVPTVPPPF
jgi:hypothetical protein